MVTVYLRVNQYRMNSIFVEADKVTPILNTFGLLFLKLSKQTIWTVDNFKGFDIYHSAPKSRVFTFMPFSALTCLPL